MRIAQRFYALPAVVLLAGCAPTPLGISSKQINAEVLKNSLTKDCSLTSDFKARCGKLAPGMHHLAVLQ